MKKQHQQPKKKSKFWEAFCKALAWSAYANPYFLYHE